VTTILARYHSVGNFTISTRYRSARWPREPPLRTYENGKTVSDVLADGAAALWLSCAGLVA
jgi:hypothetical protein